MKSKIILDTGLVDPDRSLLVENARARFLKVKKIFVMPTIRLGLSGSRVYRVKIEEEKSPLPTLNYYAKIGPYNRLKFEYESYKAYVDGRLAQVPESWFTKQKKHACLSSFAVGHSSQGDPKSLSDLLTFDMIESSKICDALNRVYDSLLLPWRKICEAGNIEWFNYYKWYLRWNRTESFIEKWLRKADLNRKRISLDSRRLASPLNKIRQIKDLNLKSQVKLRPIHGDLHQKNIMVEIVGRELYPWLIDFGWTRKFHALVDYALLESSLKAFHFARFCSEERLLQIHDFLHSGRKPSSSLHSSPEDHMLHIIWILRKKAKEEVLSETNWPAEYYLASLLITFGLIPIPTCLPRTAWLTAAWFASHIK